MNPEELTERLGKDEIYQQWSKEHPQNFLTHFFCQIDPNCQLKTKWEMGFYDQDSDKITVFVELEKGFEIKPADKIFKKDDDKVEKLEISSVKIHFNDAVKSCREKVVQDFPQEQLGDGFLILQKFKGNTIWNFSFITKTLKFVNVKIDAQTGKETSHEEISLVSK